LFNLEAPGRKGNRGRFEATHLNQNTVIAPEHSHNLAWGDADGRTLYLTAQTGLYRVRLKIEGIRPGGTLD
jgi:gluconolactonase